jgi:hypothetical protein
MQEAFGRFFGSGITRPARVRHRLMVAGDTRHPWPARCQAMVCGPASKPCSANSLRSRTINATTSSVSAVGEVFGRRERGSNAASPSTR